MYNSQVHTGAIDPFVCNMAIQAGMTGQRRNSPENRKKEIEDTMKGIEDSIRDIEVDALQVLEDEWSERTEQDPLSCVDEITRNACGDTKKLYFRRRGSSAADNVLGRGTVQKRVIDHLNGDLEDRSSDCPYLGASLYLKNPSRSFLAQLLLPLVFPQQAYAVDANADLDRRTQAQKDLETIQKVREDLDKARQKEEKARQAQDEAIKEAEKAQTNLAEAVTQAEIDARQMKIQKAIEAQQDLEEARQALKETQKALDAILEKAKKVEADRVAKEKDEKAEAAQIDYCANCKCRVDQYLGEDGAVDVEGFCENEFFAFANVNECKNFLDEILESRNEIKKLQDEFDKLEKELKRLQGNEALLRAKCIRNPKDSACQSDSQTEATAFCVECAQDVIETFYPKPTTGDRILNAAVPLLGAGLAAYSIRESNKLRSRQGYAVDNSAAYGLAWPFVNQMLYGAALTGRGSNALSCSSSAHHNYFGGGAFPGSFQGAFPGSFPGGANFRFGGGAFPGSFPGGANFRFGGGAFPGSFPGGANFRFGGGAFPGSFPGGANFRFGGGAFPGSFPGAFPGSFQGGANQFEVQSRIQSILMEQYQVSIDRQRQRQATEARIFEEMNRLQLQLQQVRSSGSYNGGAHLNLRGSFTGGGNLPGSGSGSTNNPNVVL